MVHDRGARAMISSEPFASNQEEDSGPSEARERESAGSESIWFDPLNVFSFVCQLAESLKIEVMFNGLMKVRGRPSRVESVEEIKEFLRTEPINEAVFIDRAVIANNVFGFSYSVPQLRAAVREFVRQRKTARKAEVIEHLLTQIRPLAANEVEEAAEAWKSLASVFDMDQGLVIASFKHFIWQIFRKQLGLPVDHHLMPLIIGAQGSGKTRFVETLLAPLKETASAPARTSDVVDKRVIGMLSYVVLWLDDMEQLSSGQGVENFKSFLTAVDQMRRVLGLSIDTTVKQNATLIGTSNRTAADLIPDGTGHRRFVELPFRNGNPARGGDASIWAMINSVPMELLYRSVDARIESPIMPYLEALAAHQKGTLFKSTLETWLDTLDPNDETIRSITTPHGVQAGELQRLYEAHLGGVRIGNAFSEEMERLIARQRGAFAKKTRDRLKWFYYVFRTARSNADTAQRSPPDAPSSGGGSTC
jgi:hypothetical protein